MPSPPSHTPETPSFTAAQRGPGCPEDGEAQAPPSDRDAGSLGAGNAGPLAHRRGLPVLLLLLFLIFIARLPLGQLAGGQAPPLEERHNTHSEGAGRCLAQSRTYTDTDTDTDGHPPAPTIASRERADAVTARARRWRETRAAGSAPRPQAWPSERRAAPRPSTRSGLRGDRVRRKNEIHCF